MPTYSVMVFFALLSLTSSLRAQDSLEPCDDLGNDEYLAGVDAMLDHGVKGNIVASFTTVPSFTPESGIRITLDDGVYRAHHVFLLESLWASSLLPPDDRSVVRFELSKKELPRKVASAEIPAELADSVISLMQREVEASRKTELMGFDGETYYFRPRLSECASTWSPAPGSHASKLVAITNGLGGIAHSTPGEQREQSIAAVKQLTSALSAK